MKLFYYYRSTSIPSELLCILRNTYQMDILNLAVWKKKLSRDDKSIRLDAVDSKLLKAIFR